MGKLMVIAITGIVFYLFAYRPIINFIRAKARLSDEAINIITIAIGAIFLVALGTMLALI